MVLNMTLNMALKNYPRTLLRHRINGKDLTIIGVEHTKEFFEEHKTFFEQAVSLHDALILEQGAGLDFWDSDFYGRIGEIAHCQQKRIYQVDPINFLSFSLDVAMGLLGPAVLVERAVNGIKQGPISRREFLKRLGLIGLSTSLFFGGWGGMCIRDALDIESVIDFGLDDILSYGLTDYRNIIIAEGLDEVCRQIDDVRRIVSIHGDYHSRTVSAYLANSVLRTKRLAYLPYNIISKTRIKEYKPDENMWALSRVLEI